MHAPRPLMVLTLIGAASLACGCSGQTIESIEYGAADNNGFTNNDVNNDANNDAPPNNDAPNNDLPNNDANNNDANNVDEPGLQAQCEASCTQLDACGFLELLELGFDDCMADCTLNLDEETRLCLAQTACDELPALCLPLPECDLYCDQDEATCGLFATRQECLLACDGYPREGGPDDLSGDTLQCRLNHMTLAQDDPAAHCAEAASDGGTECTDACADMQGPLLNDNNCGPAPLVTNFDGSGAIEGFRDVSGLRWDFGDGSGIGGEVTATHVYEVPGEYLARFSFSGTTEGGQRIDISISDIRIRVLEP